jgi:hypothetical protein
MLRLFHCNILTYKHMQTHMCVKRKETQFKQNLDLILPYRCKSDGTCACFDGWGGAQCDKRAAGGAPECYMDTDCEAGHVCDGGMCFCVGEECDTCGCGEFGADSTCGAAKTCSIDGTCSSHGRCKSDGSCACFPDWKGARCDIRGSPAPDDCNSDSECGEGGVCNLNSGMCQCKAAHTGASCELCQCDGFGPGCATVCDADDTCHGKGRYVCLMCIFGNGTYVCVYICLAWLWQV